LLPAVQEQKSPKQGYFGGKGGRSRAVCVLAAKSGFVIKQNTFLGDILMFKGKTVAAIIAVVILWLGTGQAQTIEDNWNDFLHYTKIGRFDLAKGYAQAVLQSNPDAVKLLALSRANPQDFEILLRVNELAPDPELAQLSGKILDIIKQGRFINRTDPVIIAEEVRRLNSTERGWFTAVKRLQNAGEYAIPFMLDAMTDDTRKDEFAKIVEALPHIGRDAIRPLAAALQMKNVAVKAEIIRALGEIRYPQAQGYLKYIMENDSSIELRQLAQASLAKIDPAALKVPAAHLFYLLGEHYYDHTQSLTPAEDADFGNIWFWDPNSGQLVSEKVGRDYFFELMAMRACEWALKADASFGQAIGLWIAAFFKAESAGIKEMPAYFGDRHAGALVYATTAGVEYLHQALARAVKDNDAYVALGVIEALATTAGEKSLLYPVGSVQPLTAALSFDSRAVRYSAAIAIAAAGPTKSFAESKLVVRNLAQALGQGTQGNVPDADQWSQQLADTYALRAADVMLLLVQTRNAVIDLSPAQSTLISAVQDKRPEIQILSGLILAHFNSPFAQRAIAAMALSETNSLEVRKAAFESLAISAKLNGYMLVEPMVDGIYALISSDDTDPELRGTAAAAYGALNLPSQKVKDLILDQAKS